MLSSKSKGGRKIADRGNPVLSHDAVKLLKTQDSGYLQIMIQKTRKARERLEGEFVLKQGGEREGVEVDLFGGKSGKGKKIVFVADESEQRRRVEDKNGGRTLEKEEGVGDEEMEAGGIFPTAPKSRKAIEKEEKLRKEAVLLRKKHRKEQNARRTKLEALKVREKDLRDAENELELQRAKMSNTVGGVNRNGVKWKQRERKK